MNQKRGSHACASCHDSLYAISSWDSENFLSSVEMYDPRANAWQVRSLAVIWNEWDCIEIEASSCVIRQNIIPLYFIEQGIMMGENSMQGLYKSVVLNVLFDLIFLF